MVRNAVLFQANHAKVFPDNLVIPYLVKFLNSPVSKFLDNPANLYLVNNVNPFHAKNADQCHLKNAKTFRLRYAVEAAVLAVVMAAQAVDEDTRAEEDTVIMVKIILSIAALHCELQVFSKIAFSLILYSRSFNWSKVIERAHPKIICPLISGQCVTLLFSISSYFQYTGLNLMCVYR